MIVDLGVWVEEFKIDVYEGLLGRKGVVSWLFGWGGDVRYLLSLNRCLHWSHFVFVLTSM